MNLRSFRMGKRGKSFLREIAIVVAGVLIALILQEIVSNLRDRQRTSAVRGSMHEEIADFAEILSFRMRAQPCIVAKLDSIEAMLRDGEGTGPWKNVGRPSFFFSSQGAWNSSASDLLSIQLPPKTFRVYGEIYQGMSQFSASGQREQAHWIVLQSLEHQKEPIAGERRWRLLESVAGARNEGLILHAIAEQMTALATELGVAPNGGLSGIDLKSRPLCQPLAGPA